jgi:kinesin family member C2/C3
MYIVHEIQGLSTAASQYNEAVKENRNLYNIIQELRGKMDLPHFCRNNPFK